MHRKSIEAAEKLGHSDDDLCADDSKDGALSECSSRASNEPPLLKSFAGAASSLQLSIAPPPPQPSHPPPPGHHNNNQHPQQQHQQQQSNQQHHSSSKMQDRELMMAPSKQNASQQQQQQTHSLKHGQNQSPNGEKGNESGLKPHDDLRSSSIAALRAKAMEHSAKVLQSLPGQTGPGQHLSAHQVAALNEQSAANSAALLYHLDRQNSANGLPSSVPYPFHSAPVRPIY